MPTAALITTGLLAFALSGVASAQAGRAPAPQAMPKKFYIGGGLGNANLKFDNTDFPRGGEAFFAADPLQQPLTDSRDQNSLGWKVFGGWRATNWLNVEAGYTNLGRAKITYTNPTGSFVDVTLKSQAVQVSLVPQFEIGYGVSFFGRLGAAYSWTDTDATGVVTGVQVGGNGKSNATNFLWGGGVAYDVNTQFGVRVEYENYGTVGEQNGSGRADSSLVSGSAIVRF
jgi:OOP family OmpA-OmpF porin